MVGICRWLPSGNVVEDLRKALLRRMTNGVENYNPFSSSDTEDVPSVCFNDESVGGESTLQTDALGFFGEIHTYHRRAAVFHRFLCFWAML